jgi:hypothetical protein
LASTTWAVKLESAVAAGVPPIRWQKQLAGEYSRWNRMRAAIAGLIPRRAVHLSA